MSELEPHRWALDVTCPSCERRGEINTSFPCCEHVDELRAELAEARAEQTELRHEVAKVMEVADAQLAVNKDIVKVMQRCLAQRDAAVAERDAIFEETVQGCVAIALGRAARYSLNDQGSEASAVTELATTMRGLKRPWAEAEPP